MQTVGQRIVVLGVTGSGKSTLSRQLSNIYGLNYIELDSLFWKSNWEETDDDEFAIKIMDALTRSDCWVVDGNYTRVGGKFIWHQSDTLIWLDYPLRVNLWRLWKRTWSRFLTRESLWDAGNKENLWKHFMTRDSLFLYAWQSHPKKKKQYTELFASSAYASHCRIHLTSPEATDLWVKSLMGETD